MSWKVEKLNDAYIVKDGTHDSPKYQSIGYPLITSKNLKNGVLNFDKINFISNIDYDNINKRSKVEVGDVLFAMIGTIGNPVLIENEPKFAIKNVALFKKSKNSSKYLLYFLKSDSVIQKMQSESKGATQKFVSLGYLRNLEIPIPPLSEQQAIVKKLDAAFALIDQAKANIEKNIQNAKELFQSKLNQIFSQKGEGWEEKKFEEICILQRGFDLPAQSRNKGSFPLVSSNGTTDYISDFKVKGPGVTTGRSGTIGKVHYISEDFWPLNTSLYIKDFRGNFEKYIFYFLNSIDILKFASGAGVPTLNRNNLHSEIFFFHNSLETQQQIVLQLDALSQQTNLLQEKYRQKLQNLEELRKSILEKAFKGELVQMSESQISSD